MENIKQNYTQSHINNFLREIDKVERTRFKESIIATRVGNATDKGYRDYMSHMRQRERVIARKESKSVRTPMTPKEKWALEAQGHTRFSELPIEDRSRLELERDSMWSQIPPHLRDKANKLAGR